MVCMHWNVRVSHTLMTLSEDIVNSWFPLNRTSTAGGKEVHASAHAHAHRGGGEFSSGSQTWRCRQGGSRGEEGVGGSEKIFEFRGIFLLLNPPFHSEHFECTQAGGYNHSSQLRGKWEKWGAPCTHPRIPVPPRSPTTSGIVPVGALTRHKVCADFCLPGRISSAFGVAFA